MSVVSKIKKSFSSALHQGLTSCELATSLTIALLSTTFPIFGLTTIVVTAVGVKKKLNIPLLIVITYSLEPLRYLVFIPLSDLGGYVLNNPDSGLTIEMIKHLFTMDWMSIISVLLSQFIYAITGWLLLFVPLSIPFFHLSKSLIGYSIPKTKQCLD